MIESAADYSDPLDVIFDDRDLHLYEEIGSQGSLSNILGNSKPPKAPTPVLKRRRRPLAELVNLPTSSTETRKSDDGKKEELRSRKDRFLFWKKKGDDLNKEKWVKNDFVVLIFPHNLKKTKQQLCSCFPEVINKTDFIYKSSIHILNYL